VIEPEQVAGENGRRDAGEAELVAFGVVDADGAPGALTRSSIAQTGADV